MSWLIVSRPCLNPKYVMEEISILTSFSVVADAFILYDSSLSKLAITTDLSSIEKDILIDFLFIFLFPELILDFDCILLIVCLKFLVAKDCNSLKRAELEMSFD